MDNTSISAIGAGVISLSSALVIVFVSKWYDRYTEHKFGSKKRLNEAELQVKIEEAKSSNTAEGYLWKRIETLENHCEGLRQDKSTLQSQLAKALDDHDESSRQAIALSLKVDELQREIIRCQEENMKLVRRIVALESK